MRQFCDLSAGVQELQNGTTVSGAWMVVFRFHAMKNSRRIAGDRTPLFVPGHRHLTPELLLSYN